MFVLLIAFVLGGEIEIEKCREKCHSKGICYVVNGDDDYNSKWCEKCHLLCELKDDKRFDFLNEDVKNESHKEPLALNTDCQIYKIRIEDLQAKNTHLNEYVKNITLYFFIIYVITILISFVFMIAVLILLMKRVLNHF